MSTVAEIEAAIAKLPPEQWDEVRRWMAKHASGGGLGAPVNAKVSWKQSASVARERDPDQSIPAETVRQALASVRE